MLEARAFINRFGMAEWRLVHGEPGPFLIDAIEIFEIEWANLQHAAAVEDARKSKS
jgi:hypothetical protein